MLGDTCYEARIRIFPSMLSGTIIQPAQRGTYTSNHVQLAYARRVYQYHPLVLQWSFHIDPSYVRHVSQLRA